MADKGKLLIADDEELLVEALVDDLSPMVTTCLTAYNGSDALNLILSEKPDAVLSDINMPGLNGLQLLERVREMGLEVPFVFLTAHGDKDKVVTALRLGAMDFLDKPYERSQLISIVGQAVQTGLELRSIEAELDQIFAKMNVSPEQKEQLRAIKRKLLIHKKHNLVKFKVAG